MGPVITIAEVADDRLADYRNLRDIDLRRQHEIFIVEGTLAIRQLLLSRYRLRSLLLTAAKLDELRPALAGVDARSPVYLAETPTMELITGFAFHRGALASAARLAPSEPGPLLAPPTRLVAVIEDVNDHENLGALFRNAAAFGVDAVLLSPGCADPLYRRSVRVSIGQVLRVPWGRLAPWPGGLEQLKAAGFVLLALTPDPSAPALAELRCSGSAIALMVGAEGPGLSSSAVAAADHSARIPMAPGVDSLNVATAAAIAFHQLTARRSER